MTDLFAQQSEHQPLAARDPRLTGDPREHVCACGAYAVFGQGASWDDRATWFCTACVPKSFFALARGGR